MGGKIIEEKLILGMERDVTEMELSLPLWEVAVGGCEREDGGASPLGEKRRDNPDGAHPSYHGHFSEPVPAKHHALAGIGFMIFFI